MTLSSRCRDGEIATASLLLRRSAPGLWVLRLRMPYRWSAPIVDTVPAWIVATLELLIPVRSGTPGFGCENPASTPQIPSVARRTGQLTERGLVGTNRHLNERIGDLPLIENPQESIAGLLKSNFRWGDHPFRVANYDRAMPLDRLG